MKQKEKQNCSNNAVQCDEDFSVRHQEEKKIIVYIQREKEKADLRI